MPSTRLSYPTPVIRATHSLHRLTRLARGAALSVAIVTSACGDASTPAASEPEDPTTVIYAAPGGWSGGDGTKANPYDLKTALSSANTLKPGGTLFLRGGTYRASALTAGLTGTADNPITVRSVPGELAVIDGAAATDVALTIDGAWTIYRDFEMTNSSPRRSGPEATRPTGIVLRGTHVALANLVVHDFGAGIRIGSDAVDSEAYGNIIYYNGTVLPSGPRGSGISTQNQTGTRRLTDNIVFNQFGSGIFAYASDEGFLDNLQFEGNVVATNGVTAGDVSMLIGGGRVAQRPVLKSNYLYDKPGLGSNLGYSVGCADIVLQDNYFYVAQGGYALQLVNCAGTATGNTFIGAARSIVDKSIVAGAELTSQFAAGQFLDAPPATNKIVVRPNRYEPGRAHVVVYNWEHAKAVEIDLKDAGVAPGATFELRDVRNLRAAPVVSGSYSSNVITVPMEGLTAAPAVGWTDTPPHSAPEFAVFLLTSSSPTAAPATSLGARLKGLIGL